MNKRSSRNNHEKRSHGCLKKKKSYLLNVTIIIISLIIIVGLGVYLKDSNNLSNDTTTDGKIDEETRELSEERPHEADIKKQPVVKKEILISFAGDFTLGTDTKFEYDGSLPAAFIKSGKNYSYFMQNVLSIFSKDDYTLVNLETTFTDSNVKTHKDGDVYYNFKGPKEYVNILTNASIDGVTIANNHIYDYGNQGIKDTINTLKENKVDICGEGYKILKDIQGIKFGFLGYTGWQYSSELRTKIGKDIKELRDQGAKVVIPYFHWGIERTYEPYDVQQKLARFSIDSGADAVVGSHPHVIQSMENYKGRLIAYSMGNFCFGGNSNPPDKRTFILQLKANIQDDGIEYFEYKVLPAMISSRNDKNDYIPTIAVNENKVDILKTLNNLSPTLNGKIKDDFFRIDIEKN